LTKGDRYDIITGLSERDGLKSEDEVGKGKTDWKKFGKNLKKLRKKFEKPLDKGKRM